MKMEAKQNTTKSGQMIQKDVNEFMLVLAKLCA